jgi:16S rRNA (cytidine1402-2'-O)-methyltransferase
MTDDLTRPALLLLPNLLGELRDHKAHLPISVDEAVSTLDGLIAESDRAGRRYLGRFKTKKPALQIPIAIFNGETPDDHLDFLLKPIREGERWGYVSDAGLPCIADPGAKLVRRARQTGIVIEAFVGPSSLLLALMLSGLPAQRFTFNGYLSSKQEQREAQIKRLESNSTREDLTQVFIETPFRNQYTFESLLKTLKDSTVLCVAWDLTLKSEGVLSQTVAVWKKSPPPSLAKRNVIFLFNAS